MKGLLKKVILDCKHDLFIFDFHMVVSQKMEQAMNAKYSQFIFDAMALHTRLALGLCEADQNISEKEVLTDVLTLFKRQNIRGFVFIAIGPIELLHFGIVNQA